MPEKGHVSEYASTIASASTRDTLTVSASDHTHGNHHTQRVYRLSSSTGVPLLPRAIQRGFHRLVKLAGVPDMWLYNSRRTATSLMLDTGTDLEATSET